MSGTEEKRSTVSDTRAQPNDEPVKRKNTRNDDDDSDDVAHGMRPPGWIHAMRIITPEGPLEMESGGAAANPHPRDTRGLLRVQPLAVCCHKLRRTSAPRCNRRLTKTVRTNEDGRG